VATLRSNNTSVYGAHGVTITNLEPATTYYFYVQSINVKAVMASSTLSPDGYSFTTQAGPKITGVAVNSINNTGATIEWNTDQPASTYIVYGTSSNLVNATEVGSADQTSRHAYNLSGLNPGTRYFFYVKSANARSYQENGDPYELITSSDLQPPVFLSISHTAVGESTAMIIWKTDELADSRLEYWAASSSETVITPTPQTTFTVDHVFSLINLATTTKYYYRVSSSDQNGNTATSTVDETTSFVTSEKQYGETDYLDKINQLKILQDLYNSASSTNRLTLSALTAEIERLTALVGNLEGTASSTDQQSQSQIGQLRQQITALQNELEQAKHQSGGGMLIIDKTDKVGPVISGVAIGDITDQGAVVTWRTNENANSFVNYSNSRYNLTSGNFDNTTNHKVELIKLDPDTQYNFNVLSVDSSGNLSKSKDQPFKTSLTSIELNSTSTATASSTAPIDQNTIKAATDNMYTILRNLSSVVSLSTFESTLVSQFDSLQKFADIIPGPIMSTDPGVELTSTTATINWTTDKPANSLVAFVPAALYVPRPDGNSYNQVVGDSRQSVTNHVVKIYDLKPDTTYHYQLQSEAQLGKITKTRDYTFHTKPTNLEIVTYTAEVVTQQSAIFRWLTSEEANTQLTYMPYRNNLLSVDEAKTIIDKTYTTTHEISMPDLEAGVVYQVELSGVGPKGTKTTKTIPYFSTTKDDLPPAIENIQTESALIQGNTLKIQTVLSWTTNEPAISQVEYQEGVTTTDNNFNLSTPVEAAYSRKHTAIITDFKPGSVYSFRVKATDSAGNSSISSVHAILTPQTKASIFDLIVSNFESTFGWLSKINN
jgi:hypothetical protein